MLSTDFCSYHGRQSEELGLGLSFRQLEMGVVPRLLFQIRTFPIGTKRRTAQPGERVTK